MEIYFHTLDLTGVILAISRYGLEVYPLYLFGTAFDQTSVNFLLFDWLQLPIQRKLSPP